MDTKLLVMKSLKSENATATIFPDYDVWSDGEVPLSLCLDHVIKHDLANKVYDDFSDLYSVMYLMVIE